MCVNPNQIRFLVWLKAEMAKNEMEIDDRGAEMRHRENCTKPFSFLFSFYFLLLCRQFVGINKLPSGPSTRRRGGGRGGDGGGRNGVRELGPQWEDVGEDVAQRAEQIHRTQAVCGCEELRLERACG
jgi:hypothetical protein